MPSHGAFLDRIVDKVHVLSLFAIAGRDVVLGTPNALNLADAALRDARAQLSALGDLAIVNGELMAGEVRLVDSSEIVDNIKATHGFGCTIFQENLRVSTTAIAGGDVRRALGTRANAKITQQVVQGRVDTILPNWSVDTEQGRTQVTPFTRGGGQEVLLQI